MDHDSEEQIAPLSLKKPRLIDDSIDNADVLQTTTSVSKKKKKNKNSAKNEFKFNFPICRTTKIFPNDNGKNS